MSKQNTHKKDHNDNACFKTKLQDVSSRDLDQQAAASA